MAAVGLLMRKSDFIMCGDNPWTRNENTHIPVTFKQAKWVMQDPAVNGPKMLLFFMTSTGMKDDVKDAAFMDLLRREQAAQDAGAAGVPDEVKPPVAEAPAVPVVAAEPNAALDTVRETLMAMEDKALIIKYSVETLGQALGLDMRWGKERIVNTIIAELGKPK